MHGNKQNASSYVCDVMNVTMSCVQCYVTGVPVSLNLHGFQCRTRASGLFRALRTLGIELNGEMVVMMQIQLGTCRIQVLEC